MTTGVTCRVYLDGIRAADGSPGDDLLNPIVLDDLAVTWGREDTMSQPEPNSCTFEVMDLAGGTAFVASYRTGRRVDVTATGQTFPDPTVPTFVNPGFEGTTVTWSSPDAVVERTTRHANLGAYSLGVRATDSPAGGSVLLAPGEFQLAGENPDAWDAIPEAVIGQTWSGSIYLLAPLGSQVAIQPVTYSGPYATHATVGPTLRTVTGAGVWREERFDVVVPATGGWLGLRLVVQPVGRRWDEVPPTVTWDAFDPELAWDDTGTVYVDDVVILAPGTGTERTVLVFSGRITDLSAAWDDAAGGPVVKVTCVGFTADLENRKVGDEPWEVESVDDRAHRILDLAALPISVTIADTFDVTLLSYRDVDRQGATELLRQIATSVDGVLWSAVHRVLGDYLWIEDPSERESLLALFEEIGPPPEIVHTNLATNPDAEAFGAVSTMRTNLATDPAATANSTTAGQARWAARWFGSTGGAGTTTLVTGASDGPTPDLRTYLRKTWTAAPVSNGDTGFLHMAPGNSTTVDATGGLFVTAGQSYHFSAYVRANVGGKQGAMTAYWRNASGAYISSSGTSTITLVAGTWHRWGFTAVAPAGATSVSVVSDIDAGTVWAVGNTLDGTGLLIENATTGLGLTAMPYFDGATPAAGDFSYAWVGAANASRSTQRAPAAAGVAAYNAPYSARWSSSVEHDTGARSIGVVPLVASATGLIWNIGPAILAGQWVTAIVRFKAPVGYGVNLAVRTSGGAAVGSVLGTGDGAWQTISTTFQSAATGDLVGAQLLTRTPVQGGVPFFVDRVILVVEAAPYTGPYFDGRTPDTEAYNYAWTGAADASSSTQSTVQTRTVVIVKKNPETGFDLSSCQILRDPVTWLQSVSDVVTRVSVGWLVQGVDDDGLPTTTEATETIVDAGLEADYGTRAVSVSTQLQDGDDARSVASKILARTSATDWRAEGLTVDDEEIPEGDQGVALLLGMLDGTSRIGAPLVIDDLPVWSPSGEMVGVYIEGGTYRYVGGRWVLDLAISAAGGQGASVEWDQLDPSWTWETWSPTITWDSLRGVGPPVTAAALRSTPPLPEET